MRTEVAMAPEELEDVFDSLDVKGSGVLTLEQFLGGFDRFLNSRARSNGVEAHDDADDLFSGEDSGISLQTQDGDEEHLQDLLQQLTAAGLHGGDALRRVWRQARDEGGARLQADLEAFLQQLARELWRRQRDYQQLEMTLERHKHEHKHEVQRLFEEMEAQLAEDREKILRQGEEKLRLSRKVLEQELANKTKMLHKTWEDHNCLTEQLQALRCSESAAKQENAQLLRSKEELELRLTQQCRELLRLQHSLEECRQNEEAERKKNLSEGFRLARSIMLEQQGLLQQLQLVRGMVATLDEDVNQKVWRSSEERRIHDASFTSFETTSGVLDDYEYDEDFCHPVFQKTDLLRTLGTQTTMSYSSGTSSLQEELESSKSSECDFTSLHKIF
ncbi:hypothetical protein R5R35_005253 [Gryllus longicercus]|uniref:EF-hand domain-containing protein n=1 Tax=Gryllus longicercus TaxID=2509291 RepID=A0AAN9W0H7_9ORTH